MTFLRTFFTSRQQTTETSLADSTRENPSSRNLMGSAIKIIKVVAAVFLSYASFVYLPTPLSWLTFGIITILTLNSLSNHTVPANPTSETVGSEEEPEIEERPSSIRVKASEIWHRIWRSAESDRSSRAPVGDGSLTPSSAPRSRTSVPHERRDVERSAEPAPRAPVGGGSPTPPPAPRSRTSAPHERRSSGRPAEPAPRAPVGDGSPTPSPAPRSRTSAPHVRRHAERPAEPAPRAPAGTGERSAHLAPTDDAAHERREPDRPAEPAPRAPVGTGERSAPLAPTDDAALRFRELQRKSYAETERELAERNGHPSGETERGPAASGDAQPRVEKGSAESAASGPAARAPVGERK